MKKLYVITSYSNRTDQQVAEIRNSVKDKLEELLGEEVELLLPTEGMKRLTAEIDAVLKADYVITTKYFEYSVPSRIAWHAAQDYIDECHDEKWIDLTLENRQESPSRPEGIDGPEVS